MVTPASLYESFSNGGISFYAGVPDSLLGPICAYITDHVAADRHIIAVNEGAAVALAAGHHLASGGIPLVYMQNSGLGNAVNPLLSLADPAIYSIPMVLMIGWRGEPGRPDEPQHRTQGRVMEAMLAAMEIPLAVLPEDEDAARRIVDDVIRQARERSGPVALIVPKGSIALYKLQSQRADSSPLTREQAIINVLERAGSDAVVVGTTGMASREIFEYRARSGQGHQRDFLTVGSMGHASQIALVVALEQAGRSVFCIDGDGAALMHMGALATNAALGGANFHHVVLNNGAHDSVGGQPTLGFNVDFPAIARASGYALTLQAGTTQEIRNAVVRMLAATGPSFLEIRIRSGNRSDLGRPTTTPVENKRSLMAFLGSGMLEAR